jgi:hypothetical protein
VRGCSPDIAMYGICAYLWEYFSLNVSPRIYMLHKTKSPYPTRCVPLTCKTAATPLSRAGLRFTIRICYRHAVTPFYWYQPSYNPRTSASSISLASFLYSQNPGIAADIRVVAVSVRPYSAGPHTEGSGRYTSATVYRASSYVFPQLL